MRQEREKSGICVCEICEGGPGSDRECCGCSWADLDGHIQAEDPPGIEDWDDELWHRQD